ncbi:MAG: hypothetical protein AAF532_03485 [Planctomycetota bacterium]
MPWPSVAAGDVVTPSAARENEIRALLNVTGAAGVAPIATPFRPLPVRVRNDTGADLPRRGVVDLDGFVFSPDDDVDRFVASPLYRAVAPTAETGASFGVTAGPIKQGDLGHVLFNGPTTVRMTGTGTGAVAEEGQTGYVVADDGGVPVRDPYTGREDERWVAVNLRGGGGCSLPLAYRFTVINPMFGGKIRWPLLVDGNEDDIEFEFGAYGSVAAKDAAGSSITSVEESFLAHAGLSASDFRSFSGGPVPTGSVQVFFKTKKTLVPRQAVTTEADGISTQLRASMLTGVEIEGA